MKEKEKKKKSQMKNNQLMHKFTLEKKLVTYVALFHVHGDANLKDLEISS